MQDFLIFTTTLPSLVITLCIVWLFESPTEKRIKEIIKEKQKIEESFLRNQEEIKNLSDIINTKQEYINLLLQEKDALLEKISHLEKESEEKNKLKKEYDDLLRKIKESEDKIKEYKNRLDALVEANRKLFSMIDSSLSNYETKDPKELSKLRNERKKLLREILEIQEVLDELYKKKETLEEENKELKKVIEYQEKELSMLRIRLEELQRSIQNRKSYYAEFFSITFENIEFSEDFIEEFIKLSHEKKKEFIKELLLLNVKDITEKLQIMRDGIFKLKPKGGRIYFTYGKQKRWRVIGSIDTEDDKEKQRYIRDKLGG